jgi:hypothetical protein
MLEFRKEATETPTPFRQRILDRDGLGAQDLAIHEALDGEGFEGAGQGARIEPIDLAEPENFVETEGLVAEVGEDRQFPRRTEPPNAPRDLSDIRGRHGHRDTSLPDVRSCL